MGDQSKKPPAQVIEPGFCSATCVDKESMRKEIKKPQLKTSDVFATCPLPKRFEYPPMNESATVLMDTFEESCFGNWFNGYGCQISKQHPFYRTSASEYGWYPPGIYSVSSIFFPAGQTFTNRLSAAGMYRNYSLNTGMDPVGY